MHLRQIRLCPVVSVGTSATCIIQAKKSLSTKRLWEKTAEARKTIVCVQMHFRPQRSLVIILWPKSLAVPLPLPRSSLPSPSRTLSSRPVTVEFSVVLFTANIFAVYAFRDSDLFKGYNRCINSSINS